MTTHRTGWFRTRWAARRAQDPEEGSWVSMLTVIMLVWVVLVIAGYVVDGSAQTRALLYADTIAGQSARYGAQTLDPATLADGQSPVLDPEQAAAEAEAYLAGYDSDLFHVSGTCHAQDIAVVCDTTVVYNTILLGIINIDTLTVHGHAQAEGTRAVDGQPR
ncbi:MAG: hypothetical protein FWH11_11425 [Micrococcales bacterium]|nr:hypothetical protein [Micrococcales bacterium]